MTNLSAITVFDATHYSEYRRPKGFRRAGLPSRIYMKASFGLGAAIFIILGYVLFGGPELDFTFLAAVLVLLVFFVLALIIPYSYVDAYGPPVRLYSDGTLEVGRKKLPMVSVSEIVVEGRTGPVTFMAQNGKELACVTKTQIINVEDFMAIVKREHPRVVIRARSMPIKVRMGKEEAI